MDYCTEAPKQLLIIGAGPYGLSTAAYAKRLGVDYQLLGEAMGFWIRHMPRGLILRSPVGRHIDLDPVGEYTFDRYVAATGVKRDHQGPISLELFLDYARWFQSQEGLEIQPSQVRELDYIGGRFKARLDDGRSLWAENVVVATGLRDHKNLPGFVHRLPRDRYAHSCEVPKLDFLKDRRCLIVGGRQSAFEWAALLGEEKAAEVHLVYRHATPAFQTSDWSCLEEAACLAGQQRRWFRNLSAQEKKDVIQRLWTQGRLKVEPWLESRVRKENIRLWPNSTVEHCSLGPQGSIEVALNEGSTLKVDFVILATGYVINIASLPFLGQETIVPVLKRAEGYPLLDENFQSSVPGLFFTGPAAARDFGPAFGFVIGCPVSARAIVHRVVQRQHGYSQG